MTFESELLVIESALHLEHENTCALPQSKDRGGVVGLMFVTGSRLHTATHTVMLKSVGYRIVHLLRQLVHCRFTGRQQ